MRGRRFGWRCGDWKAVGAGVSELRIREGKSHRVYFGRQGRTVVVLLCGGDKSTQDRDIALARSYWQEYRKQG